MKWSSEPVTRQLCVFALLLGLLSVALAATGCGKATQTNTGSGTGSMSMGSTTSAMAGMPGDPMPFGNGTTASQTGYTLVTSTTTAMSGMPTTFTFHVTGPNDKTVTSFDVDQTKRMHFYLIRSDLSGYQHVHPTMATDGTWTASLAALSAGTYRAYASFVTPDAQSKPTAFVLSVPLTVPGAAITTPVPPASPTTTADGYTLAISGQAMVGRTNALTLHVTQNGQPVNNLQPYLQTYAHLSAFHAGNLAFAHLHPQGGIATTNTGGPGPDVRGRLLRTGYLAGVRAVPNGRHAAHRSVHRQRHLTRST
jgi:hypothetical protein